MTMLDLDDLRQQIRSADYPRGTPEQVALWREDLDESRANLAIEGLDLDAEDEALFAMMLDEGLSPTAMVEVIHGLYRKPDGAC
ncbi:hypothetical protein [Sphingomonas aracearum]|uniref:Uncharacterized protein n=1 Tax=Sphingomonas aracearum TaxID=2283317 RepID=A0A369VPX0_9SPHN|nr:hypothetical protein [Sphingomonas aracearum]RDE04444.1 hypothetical protein DVW87_16135 [Sphingomonas aracearum]